MTTMKRLLCGRCGVYRDLHPTPRCAKSRHSFWWNRHSPAKHVIGTIWLNIPEKWRWSIIVAYHSRHPELCWCDMVDSAHLDYKRDDYRKPWGCGCDVSLPTESGLPRYGFCYCEPDAS